MDGVMPWAMRGGRSYFVGPGSAPMTRQEPVAEMDNATPGAFELLVSDLPARVDALALACEGLAKERDSLMFMLPMAKRANGHHFEHLIKRHATEMVRHARVILLLVKP